MNPALRFILAGTAVCMVMTSLAGCGAGDTVAPRPSGIQATCHQEWSGLGVTATWGPTPELLYASGGDGFVTRYNAGD